MGGNIFSFLPIFQHHFDPMVRKFATHLGKGAPTQGEGQLNTDLRKYVLIYMSHALAKQG